MSEKKKVLEELEEAREAIEEVIDPYASERKKLVTDLRSQFGTQSVYLYGTDKKALDVEVRSSGSLMIDLAIGGGYPKGRIIELRGFEKSGKTTLFNLAVAEAQISEPEKQNMIIDLENTYNPAWARTLGVDVNKLLVSQPDTYAEKVYDYLEYAIGTGKFAFICVDSIAGLIMKDEFEEEDWTKNSRVGGSSALNAKAMRKLINSGLLKKSGTTLIYINQLRDKIGAFSMYGTPTDTPGGRSIKHAYTQQIDVSMGEQFAKGTGESRVVLGQQIKIRAAKNKIAAPYGTASIDLYFETGVDRVMELVKVAKEVNVLQGTSWLKFVDPTTGEIQTDIEGTEIKFNGVAKTVEAVKEDISNGGELYARLFTVVNSVLRG